MKDGKIMGERLSDKMLHYLPDGKYELLEDEEYSSMTVIQAMRIVLNCAGKKKVYYVPPTHIECNSMQTFGFYVKGKNCFELRYNLTINTAYIVEIFRVDIVRLDIQKGGDTKHEYLLVYPGTEVKVEKSGKAYTDSGDREAGLIRQQAATWKNNIVKISENLFNELMSKSKRQKVYELTLPSKGSIVTVKGKWPDADFVGKPYKHGDNEQGEVIDRYWSGGDIFYRIRFSTCILDMTKIEINIKNDFVPKHPLLWMLTGRDDINWINGMHDMPPEWALQTVSDFGFRLYYDKAGGKYYMGTDECEYETVLKNFMGLCRARFIHGGH